MPGHRYCFTCGSDMSNKASAGVLYAASAPEAASLAYTVPDRPVFTSAVEEQRRCLRCMAVLQLHAPFCSMCGAPVGQPTVSAPAGMHGAVDLYADPRSVTALMPTRYAGFWLRLIAYLIDWVIIFAVLFAAGVASIVVIHVASGDTAGSQSSGTLIEVVALVGTWLYYTLMESSGRQATLGKMAIGLKVTDEEGHRISFSRANGRYWGKILSAVILAVGYMMAGWTVKKQALHDLMAGCLVISIR